MAARANNSCFVVRTFGSIDFIHVMPLGWLKSQLLSFLWGACSWYMFPTDYNACYLWMFIFYLNDMVLIQCFNQSIHAGLRHTAKSAKGNLNTGTTFYLKSYQQAHHWGSPRRRKEEDHTETYAMFISNGQCHNSRCQSLVGVFDW